MKYRNKNNDKTFLFDIKDVEHAVINKTENFIYIVFYSGLWQKVDYDEELKDRLLNKFKNI